MESLSLCCMFEFRIFEENLIFLKEKIEKICHFKKYKEEQDLYIISRNDSKNNIKIRKNELKIKTFVRKEHVFEIWDGKFFFSFPLRRDVISNIIFPKLQVIREVFTREKYTEEEFLNELVKPCNALLIAEIYKKRYTFNIDNCNVEFAYLSMKDTSLYTVAIESFHIESALKVMKLLEITDYKNMNYLEMIKKYF